MSEKKLVYIPVDKIIPHIDNPRKELGDIGELTESIRENGVLQNLTVVPCPAQGEGVYMAIIGHRRLAASKAAGLTEVPCVIAEMTAEEQIATMLLENTQRSDLTAYEQAQGFQMLIDLGETVGSISKKTGFSTSTVRRRLKMAELDQEILAKKCEGRQINLFEVDRLAEIEDVAVRNSVLDKVGTADYAWAYKKAMEEQETRHGIAYWRAALERHGIEEIKYAKIYESGLVSCNPCYVCVKDDPEDILATSDAEVCAFSGRYIYFRRKRVENVEETVDPAVEERRRAEQERQARIAALEEACLRAKACREEFMLENGFKYSSQFGIATDLLLDIFLDGDHFCLRGERFNADVFLAASDVEGYKSENALSRHSIRSKLPGTNLVRFAYACLEDRYNYKTYHTWYGTYEASEGIKRLYVFLGQLGYEPSEEERALLEGDSELYAKKD